MKIVDLRNMPEAIPAVAQWHQAEWAHLNPGETLEKRIERMKLYLGATFVPSMYVCEEDDIVVGTAAIVACDMTTRPELSPWLASVYVEKTHRKRGIGAQLVNHVMGKARDAGFRTLYLYTPHHEKFYQALGWVTLSKETYHGEPVTVMRHGPQNRE